MDKPGRCRCCGTTAYTRNELNLHPGQDWRCYWCFDAARGFHEFKDAVRQVLALRWPAFPVT